MAHETSVIIKNMYDAFGVRKQSSKIYLGDMRKQLTINFLESLEKLIEKHKEKEEYWLYAHARFDAVGKHTIRTVIVVMPCAPPKELGTMAFYVNNRQGRFEKLWVLPLDRIQLDGLLDGRAVPSIAKDAIGMPVQGIVMTP